MTGKITKFWTYTRVFRKETETWLSAAKIGFLVAKAPDGLNEREVEWPWVTEKAQKLPERGQLLDVGSYTTPLPGQLASLGFQVYALDINPPLLDDASAIEIITGDIRGTDFADNRFDVITCVSTLEHIGVKGRYGVRQKDNDGDMKAMREMHRILRSGGSLLLTVPYGRYHVLPVNRCYDRSRADLLFEGFTIACAEYFVYREGWNSVNETVAAAVGWYTQPWYALACFHLIKTD